MFCSILVKPRRWPTRPAMVHLAGGVGPVISAGTGAAPADGQLVLLQIATGGRARNSAAPLFPNASLAGKLIANGGRATKTAAPAFGGRPTNTGAPAVPKLSGLGRQISRGGRATKIAVPALPKESGLRS